MTWGEREVSAVQGAAESDWLTLKVVNLREGAVVLCLLPFGGIASDEKRRSGRKWGAASAT